MLTTDHFSIIHLTVERMYFYMLAKSVICLMEKTACVQKRPMKTR